MEEIKDYKPQFEKPGKKEKKVSRLKQHKTRELEPPKDKYCRFCGQPDNETSYYHHCEIPYLKMKYGKGAGKKIDDNLTVWAHHQCGTAMSEYPVLGDNKTCSLVRSCDGVDSKYIKEWENKWLMAIVETHLV